MSWPTSAPNWAVVERARARDAREESRARLREAQAIGRLGSWHTDVDTGDTTWSDELYGILGVDRSTRPGLDAFLAVVHPNDQEMVHADARRNGEADEGDSSLEFRVVRPDGEVRWITRRRSVGKDDAGDVLFVHTTMQDITEYKQARQCARSCEFRWHILLQGSMEILTLLDADGSMFFSLVPTLLPPLFPEDGDPIALADAVHPDDAPVVRQALVELLADPDASVGFQARFPGEDGWRWFDSVATNLLDEPLIGSIVVNSHDITAERQLVERLAAVAMPEESPGTARSS